MGKSQDPIIPDPHPGVLFGPPKAHSIAVEPWDRKSQYYNIISIENILFACRLSAINQGALPGPEEMNDKQRSSRILIRTSRCREMPAGLYLSTYRSLEALYAILPRSMFCYASQSYIINHRKIVGPNAIEKRGRARVVSLVMEDGSRISLTITRTYLRDLLKWLGL